MSRASSVRSWCWRSETKGAHAPAEVGRYRPGSTASNHPSPRHNPGNDKHLRRPAKKAGDHNGTAPRVKAALDRVARGLSHAAPMNPTSELSRIVVVGAGTMGHGIAQVAAHSGFKVALVDQDEAARARARQKIEENLAGGIQRGKLAESDRERVRANLTTTRDLAAAARDAGLVIEAIFENLAAKQGVFEAVEAAAPPAATLASNTSSLPIAQIAAALKRPERLIGMH